MSDVDETQAFLAELAADERLVYPDDAPAIMVPRVGEVYFVEVWETCHMYFHARLISMELIDGQPVYRKIEFEFDNGVVIIGLPLLLPEGYELDPNSSRTGVAFSASP